ncbi:MAG: proteasome-activating nucleotidase [Candidatus Diapherotrites archaeon CG09_land_8_20_14_0_10_32_12]|nr:MAG: proteasome-activating nucleotidase [Candidatus Diapherotrites archaeon CG09_land_8_20_14_0_10_32_12]
MSFDSENLTNVAQDRISYRDFTELPFLRTQLINTQLQLQTMQRDNERMKKELESYNVSPGIVCVVQELIGGKAIVRNYNGIVFAINVPEQYKDKFEVGTRVSLAQHNLAVLDVFSKDMDYRVNMFELEDKPNITYDSIGGLEKIITELEEMITLPLTKPELFTKFGIDSPKGILLYGPPGTGKTLIAKAVANHAKAKFISLSGSDLVQKYIGEGARLVRDLFVFARENAPAIIFIDEIDAVASYRSDSTTGGDREVYRTMMQLLVELDGFNSNEQVKVLAATNRIDIIDKALLRPGRLDRILHIDMPNESGRKKIFEIHTKKIPIDFGVSIKELAKETEGASGADIASICREAAMFAMREKNKKVSKENFKDAISKAMKPAKEPEEGGLKTHYM